MAFAEGLYDQLLTEDVYAKVCGLPADHHALVANLAAAEVHERAAEGLHALLTKLLDDLEGEKPERTARQIALVNELLADLRRRFPQSELPISDLLSPPQLLRGVFRGWRMRSS